MVTTAMTTTAAPVAPRRPAVARRPQHLPAARKPRPRAVRSPRLRAAGRRVARRRAPRAALRAARAACRRAAAWPAAGSFQTCARTPRRARTEPRSLEPRSEQDVRLHAGRRLLVETLRDTETKIDEAAVADDQVHPKLAADADVIHVERLGEIHLVVRAAIVDEQHSADGAHEDGKGRKPPVDVSNRKTIFEVREIERRAGKLSG